MAPADRIAVFLQIGMVSRRVHAAVDHGQSVVGQMKILLDLVAHHARIADHRLETRAGEQGPLRRLHVTVIGIERQTQPPGPAEGAGALLQPFAVHAIPGAVDIATGDALVRLHQVKFSCGQRPTDTAREGPVTPEPADMKRPARQHLESFPPAPGARHQRQADVLCLERFKGTGHETFRAAVPRVALANESDFQHLIVNRQDARSARELFIRKNDALNTAHQHRYVEIDNQPKTMLYRLEIGKYLCLMNGQERVNRLEFDDKHVIYKKIQAALPDKVIFVLNRNWHLAYKRNIHHC